MSRLVITAAAERDLRRLDPRVGRRVVEALNRLAETGTGDVKRLSGRERLLRLRVGDWRVIFFRVMATDEIHVTRILPRGRAYHR